MLTTLPLKKTPTALLLLLLPRLPLRHPPLHLLRLLHLPHPQQHYGCLHKPLPRPAAAGSVPVNAPMPGTILDIKVKAGAAVKAGDVVMILEAMKMENEISAPQDGTIASIDVRKGDTVNSGDVLYTMG